MPPVRHSRIALPFLCALAAAAPWNFTALRESDAGWHVALGRLVLQSGVPRTNALSWKFGATPWYDTSWLFDLAAALAQGHRADALGLQLLTLALLALTLLPLTAACAREGSAWIVPAVALLLVPRTVPRPLLVSWVVLTVALFARSRRERALAVAVVAVGSNCHTGAAFGAFVLGLTCLEELWRERKPADLALALCAGLALLANPGGFGTVRILFEHLSIDEVVKLREFEPPSWATEPALFILLPVGLLLAAARFRTRPALLVATLVFGALALRTQRMVYEAELVLARTLAWGLSLLSLRLLRGPIALAAMGLAIASHHLILPRLSTAWDEHALPVRAARFIAREGLEGPFFNGLRDGGYLDLALGRSFFDGREFGVPPQALRDWQEAERSRPTFQVWLRSIGAEWALATRRRERLGGYRLIGEPEWALIYWDDLNELFVRRDVPRFAPLLPRAYQAFKPDSSRIAAPGIFAELDRYEQSSPGDPSAALVRCAAASRQGHADAAAVCEAALSRGAEPALVAKARAQRP